MEAFYVITKSSDTETCYNCQHQPIVCWSCTEDTNYHM